MEGEMCCHHLEIKMSKINTEASFKVEQAIMSCYRAFLHLPWEEDISSLLQHILIGSLLWDPGTVLGTGGMVMNETETNPALPELVRVTDNETKNYEECGYCDPPGKHMNV